LTPKTIQAEAFAAPARLSTCHLLASVRFRVVPRRMLCVVRRVHVMRVRHVRVVRGLLVLPGLVRFRGFGMVMGGLGVMMRRLVVMLDCML
jgi:hypothetical protein